MYILYIYTIFLDIQRTEQISWGLLDASPREKDCFTKAPFCDEIYRPSQSLKTHLEHEW